MVPPVWQWAQTCWDEPCAWHLCKRAWKVQMSVFMLPQAAFVKRGSTWSHWRPLWVPQVAKLDQERKIEQREEVACEPAGAVAQALNRAGWALPQPTRQGLQLDLYMVCPRDVRATYILESDEQAWKPGSEALSEPIAAFAASEGRRARKSHGLGSGDQGACKNAISCLRDRADGGKLLAVRRARHAASCGAAQGYAMKGTGCVSDFAHTTQSSQDTCRSAQLGLLREYFGTTRMMWMRGC